MSLVKLICLNFFAFLSVILAAHFAENYGLITKDQSGSIVPTLIYGAMFLCSWCSTKGAGRYFSRVGQSAIGCALLVSLIIAISGLVIGHFFYDHFVALAAKEPSGGDITAPEIFVICALGPLTEEFLFRGLFLSILCKILPVPVSVLISALAFAIAHMPKLQGLESVEWVVLANDAVSGVMFGWLAVKYKSLWPAIVAHGLGNAKLLVGAYLTEL